MVQVVQEKMSGLAVQKVSLICYGFEFVGLEATAFSRPIYV